MAAALFEGGSSLLSRINTASPLAHARNKFLGVGFANVHIRIRL
jgi:hypothetical protein